MSERAARGGFRIVLALDPSAPSGDAFAAVRTLLPRGQQLTDAETIQIDGLFIEDDNIVRYSTLPIARQIVLTSHTVEHISVAQVEQQLRARAARVRVTFEVGVRELNVAHTFHVSRGDVLSELRRAAAAADLLVISQCRRTPGHRTWLGAAINSLLTAAPVSLLFVQEPWATGASVLVVSVDDAHPEADVARLGELAARAQGLPLHELDFMSTAGSAGAFAADPVLDTDNLIRACRRLNVRLLVLPDSRTVHEHVDLQRLIDLLPASILLVHVAADVGAG